MSSKKYCRPPGRGEVKWKLSLKKGVWAGPGKMGRVSLGGRKRAF